MKSLLSVMMLLEIWATKLNSKWLLGIHHLLQKVQKASVTLSTSVLCVGLVSFQKGGYRPHSVNLKFARDVQMVAEPCRLDLCKGLPWQSSDDFRLTYIWRSGYYIQEEREAGEISLWSHPDNGARLMSCTYIFCTTCKRQYRELDSAPALCKQEIGSL